MFQEHTWLSFLKAFFSKSFLLVLYYQICILLLFICMLLFYQNIYMSIRVINFLPFFKIYFQNYGSWGKWLTVLHWIQNSFPFFCKLPHFGRIPFWNSEKSKGGPFGEKNMKKIDFYVWYLKRTALKNVDWQWNRFLKILIFGGFMDQKVPKNRHFQQFWWF